MSAHVQKVAVVGKGKTGQSVISVLGESRVSGIYSRSNPVTVAELKKASAVIVFVPAEGFSEILPLLIESRVPVVCGTTGFTWPSDFGATLEKNGVAWIVGSNFSPGMNFFFAVAKLIEKNRTFLGNPDLSIYELHHVHKKDSPSGTALSLKKFFTGGVPIKADREGEHRGLHELTVQTPLESLTFKHEAADRRAFAEGAVYAADQLLNHLKPGLHHFETLMIAKILEEE